jgi:hypothetical protein
MFGCLYFRWPLFRVLVDIHLAKGIIETGVYVLFAISLSPVSAENIVLLARMFLARKGYLALACLWSFV